MRWRAYPVFLFKRRLHYTTPHAHGFVHSCVQLTASYNAAIDQVQDIQEQLVAMTSERDASVDVVGTREKELAAAQVDGNMTCVHFPCFREGRGRWVSLSF